jgi:hypothetical protein
MSAVRLMLRYEGADHLAAHLEQQKTQGAVLVAHTDLGALEQYQPVTLVVSLPDGGGEVEAEVLQVIPNLGVAVLVKDPVAAFALAGGASPADVPVPPEVSLETPRDQPGKPVKGPDPIRGGSVVSWPIEKLQSEWQNLALADRIRVARYGKRPARAFVLKQHDSQLHQFLLSNPHVSVEEVAALAAMGSLDPALLKRLVSSQEWTRHTSIARNLICHPKATLPQVTRLLDKVPQDELRRLTRTGKVRASVKRLIIKKLEQRRG